MRQDHRVAVAVRHEHRHVDGAEPLEQGVIGIPHVQTASYCASRVAQVVALSRSSVRACMRCRLAGRPPARRGRGEEDIEVFPGPGFGGADGADDLGGPAVHAGRALRRGGRQDKPPHEGRPGQRDSARRSCRWRTPADRPGRGPWRRGTRGRRGPSAPRCPVSSRWSRRLRRCRTAMTRRADASASISAGSQLSRFPRKCWRRTSGTPPSPPVSRYA